MSDCMSINPDGTCKHHQGSKCLCNDKTIRGFFGTINVCSPVGKALGIEQIYSRRINGGEINGKV